MFPGEVCLSSQCHLNLIIRIAAIYHVEVLRVWVFRQKSHLWGMCIIVHNSFQTFFWLEISYIWNTVQTSSSLGRWWPSDQSTEVESSMTRVQIPPKLGHFFKLSSSGQRNLHADNQLCLRLRMHRRLQGLAWTSTGFTWKNTACTTNGRGSTNINITVLKSLCRASKALQ